jgi:hypothetical protein
VRKEEGRGNETPKTKCGMQSAKWKMKEEGINNMAAGHTAILQFAF